MTKDAYLAALGDALEGMERGERERTLNFYAEMIDDRIEDGEPEFDAVARMETPRDVAERLLGGLPDAEPIREAESIPACGERAQSAEPETPRRDASKTVWIILASPIWLPLGLAAAGVAIGLIAAVAGLLVGIWGAGAGLALGGLYAVGTGLLRVFHETASATAQIGAGLFAAGLSVFALHGAFDLTKWIVRVTRI